MPFLLSCAATLGEMVVNRGGEELGQLEHLVVDVPSGRVAYGVLVRGGVLGLGGRYHAFPWDALDIDAQRQRMVLDIARDELDVAPGFDDEHWPTMEDADWAAAIRAFYARPRAARRRSA